MLWVLRTPLPPTWGIFVLRQTNPFPAISSPVSFKTVLRRSLGNSNYRMVTQTLRVLRFLWRPHYEPEIEALAQFIQPGMTCFDIGANYGHYSRVLSPMVGDTGAIYAFEPSSITCHGLRSVQRLLRWKNVHVTQCALADVPGELTLTIPIKSHGGLGIALAHLGKAIDRPGITETVTVETLDGFMARHDIHACDFIKCDVEGAELLVLRGGFHTITHFKPIMMLEIDATYLRRNNHTVEDVEALLKLHGYGFYLWDKGVLHRVDGLHDRRNNFLIHSK